MHLTSKEFISGIQPNYVLLKGRLWLVLKPYSHIMMSSNVDVCHVMTAPSENTAPEADRLFQQTQDVLRSNLLRVLPVSETKDGKPTKLSSSRLSQQTRIARSTIVKLLTPRKVHSDEKESEFAGQSNPDLRTLCRLAQVLNLPPAFLLMGEDDWRRLLSAIGGLPSVMNAVALDSLQASLEQAKSPVGRVELALQILKECGCLPRPPLLEKHKVAESSELWLHGWEESQSQQHQAIRAATALPSYGSLPPAEVGLLFVLSALLGAATNMNK